ncbi:hypothetical protein ACXR6G_07870 [Ancylomarina sp. YFZ004]
MKRLLLLTILTLSGNFIFAQDIIIKRNGGEIQSKILEITIETIKYKKFDNQTGPIRNIAKSDVFMIIYENGEREKFELKKETIQKQTNSPSYNHEPTNYVEKNNKLETASEKPKSNYKGKYFMLGMGYGNSYGGLGIRTQWRFGGDQGFGFHAGVGYLPDYDIMASVGLKFFPYKNFYINSQFGIFGYEESYEFSYNSYGYYNDYGYEYEALYGPSLMVGGDWTWGDKVGYGFNAAIGVSYNVSGFSDELWPAIDMGFLVRF